MNYLKDKNKMKNKEENTTKLQCKIKKENFELLKKNAKQNRMPIGTYLDKVLSNKPHDNKSHDIKNMDDLINYVDTLDYKMNLLIINTESKMNLLTTAITDIKVCLIKPWWKRMF